MNTDDARDAIDPTQLAEAEALGRAAAPATGGGVGIGGEGLAGGPLDRALATLAEVAGAILAPRRMRERAFEELEAVRSLRAERDAWRDLARGLVAEDFRRDGIPGDRVAALLEIWAEDAGRQIAGRAKEGGAP